MYLGLIRGWLQQWDQKSSDYSHEALWSPGSGWGLRLRHPDLRSRVSHADSQSGYRQVPGTQIPFPMYSAYIVLSSCAQRLGDASVGSTTNAKMLAYGG